MDANEVVEHGMQGDGACETISQAGKAAHRHTPGQVLPFHKRRADLIPVGIAKHRLQPRADANGRAVTTLWRLGMIRPVHLHKHRVVDATVPERATRKR